MRTRNTGHVTGDLPWNFLLAILSVAAVGVTTRTGCVNARLRLNRLASQRGSFAENSANLPPAAPTTLTYTVSLYSLQKCAEGHQEIGITCTFLKRTNTPVQGSVIVISRLYGSSSVVPKN